MSGGLDSQLAVRVLEEAGAVVEAVTFVTPFFDGAKAEAAARALGVKLHVIDFLNDEISLIENPPHGFGGAMNPCIDCHALMIRRAGELMTRLRYDFVATGEVRGQRPMSQNAQSLITVEKASGLEGRLVRPLSAKLLAPTIPEKEGLLDRAKLLDISGRARDRQIALAAKFGIRDYPSPAGGCKLTEEAFGRKLRDLKGHEGLHSRTLVELLLVAAASAFLTDRASSSAATRRRMRASPRRFSQGASFWSQARAASLGQPPSSPSSTLTPISRARKKLCAHGAAAQQRKTAPRTKSSN